MKNTNKNSHELFARLKKNKSRWKSNKFNPDSRFIEGAIGDYLRRGGKITRIEINRSDHVPEAGEQNEKSIHDFLCDSVSQADGLNLFDFGA